MTCGPATREYERGYEQHRTLHDDGSSSELPEKGHGITPRGAGFGGTNDRYHHNEAVTGMFGGESVATYFVAFGSAPIPSTTEIGP